MAAPAMAAPAVAGATDSGKSSLAAVLTHGADGRPHLDDGRGRARVAVLRHKHEVRMWGRAACACVEHARDRAPPRPRLAEPSPPQQVASGRTSSIAQALLGYDAVGRVGAQQRA
jgi:hypothetical protein